MQIPAFSDMFKILILILAAAITSPGATAETEPDGAFAAELPVELAWGLARDRDNVDYVQWADWIRYSPALLGQVSYRNEPLLAGEKQNLSVVFVPGMALPVGSLVTVMAPWQSGIEFQAVDASAPNYVSAATSGSNLLAPTATAAPVPFASWYEGNLMLAFEVRDVEIAAGETLEFQLANVTLPGEAGPLKLPVVFRLPEQQVMVGGARVNLTVRPNRTERVQLAVPSRLGRNQSAEAQLLLQDRYGNPSADRLPTFDVLLDGEYFQRVEPVSDRTVIAGIQFDEPGRHQVEVRTGGGSLRAVSNPVIVQSGNKQITWLDLAPQKPAQGDGVGELDVRLRRQSLSSGGSLFEISGSASNLAVATPFLPTDDRGLDASVYRLVQIASGDSQYPWLANRLWQAGYRLGFAAGSFSPLAPVGPSPRSGLTAVLGTASVFDGLTRGSTYATTGSKMVVHATVNGAEPGRRIKRSKEREIMGWVQGTGPLDRIELVKNGEVIASQSVASRMESSVLRVSVKSSSAPFKGQRDLPRNGREWIGFLRASNASLELLAAPGFRNPVRQAIAQNGRNRVDFITWTHGGSSSFMVNLGETAEDEVIELNLRAGFEDSDINPGLRPPAQLPPVRLMIPFYELENGPVTRFVDVNGYQDEIRFELVDPAAPDYAEFRFADASAFAEEDYYYLQILQLDDHVAWTSPVFVGGFDPR